jgi:hypothetical protein
MEAKKMPAKNDKTARNINNFAVGDHVKVNMHRGRMVDATIKAIIDRTDGKRLQVGFGKDETALIHLWQVVKLLGHRTMKVTQRHYNKWVQERQRNAEAVVRNSWSRIGHVRKLDSRNPHKD